MALKYIPLLLFVMAVFIPNQKSFSQYSDRDLQLEFSQKFRLAERIIRIAEPGQLADTVNLWGDVNSPGRYLIPTGTKLPELISYGFGPFGLREQETTLDWSKVRIEVNISGYDRQNGRETIKSFKFRYNEPLPAEMRTFQLKNNQVISLQVKRRPAFIDYVQVVVPVISGIATTIFIIDAINRN